MILSKACKTKMAALFIGLMALMPVQAITQEEMVYDQVSKYIRGSEAAAIAKDICDASYTYDVDPILVAAVFTTESHFDNSAVSGVGAVGIAQLMPSTAASAPATMVTVTRCNKVLVRMARESAMARAPAASRPCSSWSGGRDG